ncbi:MAG: hypothetical protein LBG73_06610 [Spirochaetaceae bacterium]|jgi:hypothetical protein|nr:hypothetical protein [Spirochaetaceae bacterium]
MEYLEELSNVLEKRRAWIEESQLDKLKERLQAFYSAYNALYLFLIQKGALKEDPYKNESSIEIGKIHIPKTSVFAESTKTQDLSVRLADYDTQLNILANFFPLSLDALDFGKINLVMGLVKYIDWSALTPESDYPVTKAVAEIKRGIMSGKDSSALNAPASLAKIAIAILGCLKIVNHFNREFYKYELRATLADCLTPENHPTPGEIKKRLAAASPNKTFYNELAEELLKEDYSPQGAHLREEVLRSLRVAEEKHKTQVSNRYLLMDGIQIIGSISSILHTIEEKFDYNKYLLEDPEPSFWVRLQRFIDKMMSKQPKPAVFEVEYEEPSSKAQTEEAKPIKKRIVYEEMKADLEKKSRNLAKISFQGAALIKFEALSDEELLNFLERAAKGISNQYKLLIALDSFFKTKVDEKYRGQVKGIKPELSAMKNAYIKATEKSAEYTALKEAEEIRKWLPRPQQEEENREEPVEANNM